MRVYVNPRKALLQFTWGGTSSPMLRGRRSHPQDSNWALAHDVPDCRCHLPEPLARVLGKLSPDGWVWGFRLSLKPWVMGVWICAAVASTRMGVGHWKRPPDALGLQSSFEKVREALESETSQRHPFHSSPLLPGVRVAKALPGEWVFGAQDELWIWPQGLRLKARCRVGGMGVRTPPNTKLFVLPMSTKSAALGEQLRPQEKEGESQSAEGCQNE